MVQAQLSPAEAGVVEEAMRALLDGDTDELRALVGRRDKPWAAIKEDAGELLTGINAQVSVLNRLAEAGE